MKKSMLALALLATVGTACAAAEQNIVTELASMHLHWYDAPVLRYQDKNLGDERVAAYVPFWKQSLRLKSLILSGNGITDRGVESIANSLMDNLGRSYWPIEELVLGRNPITDAGAEKLAKALRNHPSLKKLYIHETQLTDAGYQHFVQALDSNKKLTVLNTGKEFGNTSPEIIDAINQSLELNKTIAEIKGEPRHHFGLISKKDVMIPENPTLGQLKDIMATIKGHREIAFVTNLENGECGPVDEDLIQACLTMNTKASLECAYGYLNQHAIAYLDSKQTYWALQARVVGALHAFGPLPFESLETLEEIKTAVSHLEMCDLNWWKKSSPFIKNREHYNILVNQVIERAVALDTAESLGFIQGFMIKFDNFYGPIIDNFHDQLAKITRKINEKEAEAEERELAE